MRPTAGNLQVSEDNNPAHSASESADKNYSNTTHLSQYEAELVEIVFESEAVLSDLAKALNTLSNCGYKRPRVLLYDQKQKAWLLPAAEAALTAEKITPGSNLLLAESQSLPGNMADPAAWLLLQWVAGDAAGSIVVPAITGSSIVLGRSAGCTAEISHVSVSRRHLRLDFTPAGMLATDLKSRNGTVYDGANMQPGQPVQIPANAVLRCGRVRIALYRIASSSYNGCEEPRDSAQEIAISSAGAVTLAQIISATAPETAHLRAVSARTIDVARAQTKAELPSVPEKPNQKLAFKPISVLAPILLAAVMYLIIKSPYVLIFALASPLMMFANRLEGSRGENGAYRVAVRAHWQEVMRALQQEKIASDAACAAWESAFSESLQAVRKDGIKGILRFFKERNLCFLGIRSRHIYTPQEIANLYSRKNAFKTQNIARIVSERLQQPELLTFALPSNTTIGVVADAEHARDIVRGLLAQLLLLQNHSGTVTLCGVSGEDLAWLRTVELIPESLGCDRAKFADERTRFARSFCLRSTSSTGGGAGSGVRDATADVIRIIIAQTIDALPSDTDYVVCVPALNQNTMLIEPKCDLPVPAFGEPKLPLRGYLDFGGVRYDSSLFPKLNALDFNALCVSLAQLAAEQNGKHQVAAGWLQQHFNVSNTAAAVEALAYRWKCKSNFRLVFDGSVCCDLINDGPHVLLAGMTGSGKSELLQSLLLGLACDHNPQMLQFLLIDFKGSASFGVIAELPHVAGLVTDIDRGAVSRVFKIISAELVSREQRFRAVKAADYNEYLRLGLTDMARLVIVFDEFAALLRHYSAAAETVADIAQRGRSLGLHLIIATQHPAGVVSDKVRSNTQIRVALRVASKQYSVDVIGVSNAAEISNGKAGSGYLKAGLKEPLLFNSRAVNEPLLAPRVRVRIAADKSQKNRFVGSADGGESIAQVLVAQMRQLAAARSYSAEKIWLPRLSENFFCSKLQDADGIWRRTAACPDTSNSSFTKLSSENLAELRSSVIVVQDDVYNRRRIVFTPQDICDLTLILDSASEARKMLLDRFIKASAHAGYVTVILSDKIEQSSPAHVAIAYSDRYRLLPFLNNLHRIKNSLGENQSILVVCDNFDAVSEYLLGADKVLNNAFARLFTTDSKIKVVIAACSMGALPQHLKTLPNQKIFGSQLVGYDVAVASLDKELAAEIQEIPGRFFWESTGLIAQVVECAESECCASELKYGANLDMCLTHSIESYAETSQKSMRNLHTGESISFDSSKVTAVIDRTQTLAAEKSLLIAAIIAQEESTSVAVLDDVVDKFQNSADILNPDIFRVVRSESSEVKLFLESLKEAPCAERILIVIPELQKFSRSNAGAFQELQSIAQDSASVKLLFGYTEAAELDWDIKKTVDAADTVCHFAPMQTMHRKMQLVDYRHESFTPWRACVYTERQGAPEINYAQLSGSHTQPLKKLISQGKNERHRRRVLKHAAG